MQLPPIKAKNAVTLQQRGRAIPAKNNAPLLKAYGPVPKPPTAAKKTTRPVGRVLLPPIKPNVESKPAAVETKEQPPAVQMDGANAQVSSRPSTAHGSRIPVPITRKSSTPERSESSQSGNISDEDSSKPRNVEAKKHTRREQMSAALPETQRNIDVRMTAASADDLSQRNTSATESADFTPREHVLTDRADDANQGGSYTPTLFFRKNQKFINPSIIYR